MSCTKVDRSRFLSTLSILAKVVGRSDEIFRFVEVGKGRLAAWDGCFRLFVDFDVDVETFSVPMVPFLSFIRMCDEDVRICRDDKVVLECGDLKAVAIDDERRVPKEELGEAVGKVRDFVSGLDFVSKAADDEDNIEIHLGKSSTAHTVTSNLSIFYLFDGVGKKVSFSVPYQSARRIVKSLKGIKEVELFFGKSLGFRSGVFRGFVCGERLREPTVLPRIEDVEKLGGDFKRLISKAADLLGNSMVDLSVKNGRVIVSGRRGGLTLLMSGEVDLGLSFSVSVPMRKFRSYLSSMSSVWVSKGNGVVRFVDGKRKRYVITREAV